MAGRKALRPDTTLAPVGEPEAEVYVWRLSACCLGSLKEAVVEKGDRRRFLELRCSCGRSWHVTNSLDERVLGRFVIHGGPRVRGGFYPAA